MEASYRIVTDWQSPATGYPRATKGLWTIASRQQSPGVYRMQDSGVFYYHAKPIDLTVLLEASRVWFTDEPRQIYALSEIGLFRARGHVVVGGLGLGLIHHFLKNNPKVTHVTTIERAPELEELVWPHVRVGSLVIGDFYDVLPQMARHGTRVDTIITDFIFGYQSEATWKELEVQRDFCRGYFPEAQFLEHGWQRRIDREVVEKVLPPSQFGQMFDQVKIVT